VTVFRVDSLEEEPIGLAAVAESWRPLEASREQGPAAGGSSSGGKGGRAAAL
jgi:hypothetical protein